MVALAGEIADGVVFANVARSHLADVARGAPRREARRPRLLRRRHDPDLHLGRPRGRGGREPPDAGRSTCTLPNYRNAWRDAGYADEMDAVEKALAAGERERVAELPGDRWLADCTLYGSAAEVRDGVDAWLAAGLRTPILVPSSAAGNQLQAFEELFAAFAD